MDSRFYKKEHVKYNLYPQQTKVLSILSKILITNSRYKRIKKEFDRIISDIFSVDKQEIFYFSSASKALENYLKALSTERNIRNIYIPSFSCIELADAIVKSNCNLKVYDIQENLKPSIKTLYKISQDSTAVLILPSLFGKDNYPNDEYLKVLSELSIPIILDEAQTFPNISFKLHSVIKKCAILISFGKSKPISSIGGGAVINKALLSNSSKLHYKVNTNNYYKKIFVNCGLRIKNKIAKYFGIYSNKYKSLEDLVFDKKQVNPNNTMEIDKLEIIMAYFRTIKYKKLYLKRRILKDDNLNLFGEKTFLNYNYLPLIIINANRYEFMKQLGKKGIQSTLYYYPIHLIPFYKEKWNLSRCPISEKIFSKIVIIPFGIDYSNKNLKNIIKKIGEIILYEKVSNNRF